MRNKLGGGEGEETQGVRCLMVLLSRYNTTSHPLFSFLFIYIYIYTSLTLFCILFSIMQRVIQGELQ